MGSEEGMIVGSRDLASLPPCLPAWQLPAVRAWQAVGVPTGHWASRSGVALYWQLNTSTVATWMVDRTYCDMFNRPGVAGAVLQTPP